MRFEHPGLGVPDEHDEGEVGTACKHKTHGKCDTRLHNGVPNNRTGSKQTGLQIVYEHNN